MKYVTLIICLLWGSLAAASDFPKLYAVIGVAADDTLNIRAEPNAKGEWLGAFKYNATGVEVIAVSEDGKWGQVNINERTGWSAMKFLAPMSDKEPFFAICFGTEPFWGLVMDKDGGTSRWATPESKGTVRNLEPMMTTAVMPRTFAYSGQIQFEDAGTSTFEALVTHKICSDGMSDNLYGLSVDLMMGTESLSGCCTFQRY